MPYVKRTQYISSDPDKRQRQLQNLVYNRLSKAKKADVIAPKLQDFDYSQDIIKFLEEQFYIPETKRPIVLEDFQKEKILKPLFYGDRPYTMALIGEPKKSGKSCLAAGIAEWYLFTQGLRPGENVEVMICASDKDQASWIVFNKLVKSLEMNKGLLVQSNITQDSITIPHKGSVLRCLPTDVSGAGGNADLVIFDELYLYKYPGMRDFFEVMTTVPTKPHPLILIFTTAGYGEDEDDLLFSLYLKGMKKADPTFYLFWDEGEKANRMPWQTKEYLKQQQGRLRPATFQRLHLNYWTSGEEIFINPEAIDACIDNKLSPALPNKGINIVVGVDVGIKHDSTAVVSTAREGNKIKLINVKKFQGSPGKEVQLEEQVEGYILQLAKDFTIIEVLYDPYQFTRSSQTLTKKGVRMTEYPQTLDRLTQMSQNLYDLIQGQNLIFFKDKDLRKHLINSKAKESTRGWRIVKRSSSQKIDCCIALAMSCQGSIKEEAVPNFYAFGPGPGEDDFDNQEKELSESNKSHNGWVKI
jgi:phage terminase large subunit-like protein